MSDCGEFDYRLPLESIAQIPAEPRGSARLLRRPTGGRAELLFFRPAGEPDGGEARRWEVLARPSRKLSEGQELNPWRAMQTTVRYFTRDLLDRLDAAGVCTAFVYLEIGADTLGPLRPGPGKDHEVH